MQTFQQIILALQPIGIGRDALLQPYDMKSVQERRTATFLPSVGAVARVRQPSAAEGQALRRKSNPMRHYYQYQVVLKPAPPDILDRYLSRSRRS
jgi:glycyl-tRNA synthetase alpha chain